MDQCKSQLRFEITLHVAQEGRKPLMAKVGMNDWVKLSSDPELIMNAIVLDHEHCVAHFKIYDVDVYLDPRLPEETIVYYNEYQTQEL